MRAAEDARQVPAERGCGRGLSALRGRARLQRDRRLERPTRLQPWQSFGITVTQPSFSLRRRLGERGLRFTVRRELSPGVDDNTGREADVHLYGLTSHRELQSVQLAHGKGKDLIPRPSRLGGSEIISGV